MNQYTLSLGLCGDTVRAVKDYPSIFAAMRAAPSFVQFGGSRVAIISETGPTGRQLYCGARTMRTDKRTSTHVYGRTCWRRIHPD